MKRTLGIGFGFQALMVQSWQQAFQVVNVR
jgi:hypothetical protein